MWRDFLRMSKAEQLGFAVVLLLIMASLLLQHITALSENEVVDEALVEWLSKLEVADEKRAAESEPDRGMELFVFDPNVVKVKEMERLGLKSYAILNIIKYREAGGRFRNVETFKNVYGIDSFLFEKLEPFIKINPDPQLRGYVKRKSYPVDLNRAEKAWLSKVGVAPLVIDDIEHMKREYYFCARVDKDSLVSFTFNEWKKYAKNIIKKRNRVRHQSFEAFTIELNSADTAELRLLKGIGSYYANKIVWYRKALGGFYTVDQLLEIEGISPLILEDNKAHLVIDASLINPINVHTAGLRRMKRHPYLNFYMAKEIYEYRKEGRDFESLTDVFKLPSFQNQDTAKLKLYLSL